MLLYKIYLLILEHFILYASMKKLMPRMLMITLGENILISGLKNWL